jgi:hypothetical protein
MLLQAPLSDFNDLTDDQDGVANWLPLFAFWAVNENNGLLHGLLPISGGVKEANIFVNRSMLP